MRISKAPLELVAKSQDEITEVEALLGARSDGFQVMVRKPGMAKAVAELVANIYDEGAIGHDLKVMISYVVSRATGSKTGMAQATRRGILHDIPKEKLRALANFEESPKFTEVEKAALRIAFRSGSSPNRVTDADFEAARAHFDDDQLVDIVGVIAMAGFLNRWNDTIATHPDQDPAKVVQISTAQVKTVETIARRKARLSNSKTVAEPFQLVQKVEDTPSNNRTFRSQKEVRAHLAKSRQAAKASFAKADTAKKSVAQPDAAQEASQTLAKAHKLAEATAANPAQKRTRRPNLFKRYRWI